MDARRGSSEPKVPLHMLSALRVERNNLNARLAAALEDLSELRRLMQAEARCKKTGAHTADSAPPSSRNHSPPGDGLVALGNGVAGTNSDVLPPSTAENGLSATVALGLDAADENGWTLRSWVQSLKVDDVVANILKTDLGRDATSEEQFRYAQKLDAQKVASLLLSAESVQNISAAIANGATELRDAGGTTAHELNAKFSEQSSYTMSVGSVDVFYGGLERLLGPPRLHNGSLHNRMQWEHCDQHDSNIDFQSSNGMTTKSRDEWEFVVSPNADKEYAERGDMLKKNRTRKQLQLPALIALMEEQNVLLVAAKHVALIQEEVVGARLYTGPMYEKYNLSLRSKSGDKYQESRFVDICIGNLYVTTIHAINSCIIKMSKLTKATRVYRGLQKASLPDEYLKLNEFNLRGGVEYAFMSTTSDQSQAAHYAQGAASTVFEMDMGMIDRGADVSWLSQYQHEKEILFPPLVGIEVKRMHVRASTLVVEVRLSLNLMALTLEQVLDKMKYSHVSMLETLINDHKHKHASRPKDLAHARDELAPMKELLQRARRADGQDFNNPNFLEKRTVEAMDEVRRISVLKRLHQDKGDSKPTLKLGDVSLFFAGLEQHIGAPNPNVLDTMAHEHCAGPDAKLMFTCSDISTFSPWEWYFVYDPDKGKAEALPHGKDWPSEQYPADVVPRGEIRHFRKALSLASFDVVLREKNQRLESVGAKKLQTVEFVALRLYTGPMFMKYNTALRKCGKDPFFVDLFRELNHGNEYTTTLHVINSGIIKLCKITAQSKVYRSFGNLTLTLDDISRPGVDISFFAGTLDPSVARQVAGGFGLMLDVQLSAVDGCAELSWLSQYPHEEAVALPALTALEFTGLEVQEQTLIARVNAHVSPVQQTIEQVIAKMQSANIQLLDNIRANLLQANPPPRVLLALDGLRGTQAARDPAFFNEASNFRAATEIALSEQKEAFAVLADEEVWSEVAMEMDADREEVVEALSVRMWNAALVAAQSGEHAAASKLLRQSMRWAVHEERALPLEDAQPHGTGDDRLSTGLGPKVTRSMMRKQSMMAKIEEKIGAVGGQGLAQEDFVSMARELLPSLPEKQAQHIFNECDKDNSGTIGSAETQEVLEMLLDVETGSDAGTLAKGSKPLFSTRAALARPKPRRLSLEDRNDLETPTSVREREICAAVKVATEAVSSEKQREDIQLVAQLLKLGVPQPWPATLCHLVENIDGGPNAAAGAEPAVGTELVRRIVTALWEDRMAVGEEVLVLQHDACNLWKKAIIEAHSPAPDGKPGCFYDVTFALGQVEPIKGMPANNVLPVEEGGAGALLRAAAIAGDNGLVQALLKAGVHVYEASPDGNTALHAAASTGHAAVYKTLMDEAGKFPVKNVLPEHAFTHLPAHAAHASTRNFRGMCAFDFMMQGQHIRCLRLIFPSSEDKEYISALKEMDQLPELLVAACKGGVEQLARVVAQVSERGEGVDATTSGGMTALMLACRKGPSSKNRGEGVEEKVRTLLEKRADVNAKSTAGCVALAFAAAAGNPRVVSMLLQKNADVEALSPDGMTPLLLAVGNGWTQAAELLLDAGAEVNRRQKGGYELPPIIWAATHGHTACVDMLIRRKAEVNYTKSDGTNALILAAEFNQLEVVRLLVRNGARVEDALWNGHTALLHASKTGHGPVVRALLQLGANPLHLGVEGHSALHLASKGGYSDVVSALLQGLKSQREFDINLTTPAGDSALHLACVNGSEKVVDLLVDYRADQRMRDSNGRDAYAIAKDGGHAPVCVLLQPTREQMITTFTTLSTADAFMRARDSLTVENIKALKRELVGVGVIDEDCLSTRPAGCDAVPSFFARLSSAAVDESQPELCEENKAMWQENELKGRRGQQFLLATWKPGLSRVEPSADRESFEGGAAAAEVAPAVPKLSEKLGKLGCVPLPNRHRFLLLNNDLSWRKFNVLVLGKSGLPNELNEAVTLIEDMKAEALAFAARSGWSKSTGLYFEPYPHASADALYLHIMDEMDPKTGEHVGPPEELRKQLLTLEDVLDVIKTEARGGGRRTG